MTMFQAVVLGLIQGIFELFPLSSLGHTVLIPSWIGGNWATLVRQESLSESPYLSFIVGLHLANAIVLLLFYIREWGRLLYGFFRSVARRKIETDTERLAWLIVIATIPVGVIGLAFEHTFRTLFAKPTAAAAFLTVNGLILFSGEWFRRRAARAEPAVAGSTTLMTNDRRPAAGRDRPSATATGAPPPPTALSATESSGRLESPAGTGTGPRPLSSARRFRDEKFVSLDPEDEAALVRQVTLWSAIWIGAAQSLALLAGISREGVAMVGGLYRGLSNENALRFAFLLSTPVIFAAGALKVPDLVGPLGKDIHGQIVAGSLAAVVASFVAIVLLTRYFKTHTLVPFAIYSIVFGLASVVRFGVF